MRLINAIMATIALAMLSGCMTQAKPIEVPKDFVKQIDSTQIMAELNELVETDGFDVRFASGQKTLSPKAIRYIETFIEAYEPQMVAVMGTAGAEKYRELGEIRTHTLVLAFYERGIDSIMLEYRANSKGKRGVFWALPNALSAKVRTEAPSMVISGQVTNTMATTAQ